MGRWSCSAPHIDLRRGGGNGQTKGSRKSYGQEVGYRTGTFEKRDVDNWASEKIISTANFLALIACGPAVKVTSLSVIAKLSLIAGTCNQFRSPRFRKRCIVRPEQGRDRSNSPDREHAYSQAWQWRRSIANAKTGCLAARSTAWIERLRLQHSRRNASNSTRINLLYSLVEADVQEGKMIE